MISTTHMPICNGRDGVFCLWWVGPHGATQRRWMSQRYLGIRLDYQDVEWRKAPSRVEIRCGNLRYCGWRYGDHSYIHVRVSSPSGMGYLRSSLPREMRRIRAAYVWWQLDYQGRCAGFVVLFGGSVKNISACRRRWIPSTQRNGRGLKSRINAKRINLHP